MANISFVHARDHADVLFVGTLDWEAAHELVTTLETVFDHYFYRQVELLVSSPGGDTRALAYYLNAVRNWSNKGIRFRTRVISTAASAGAFMVTRANDAMIGRLVERALAGTCLACEHGAEEADREVLEGLCLGAAPDPAATAPARIQTLATALGQTVDDAIGEHDPKSLSHLYHRLFQLDRPISGKLALTLRLVNRVAETGHASPDAPGIPSSPASKATPFASPAGEIARETLLRHVLVLGDDQSSVTHLCLAPLVAALARAPRSQVGPVLVLDPGPELHSALCSVAHDRVFTLEPDSLVLDLMPGSRSLAPVLEAGHWMSGAAKVLERTLSLVPGSPARFLRDASGRIVELVVREGTNLALSVLGLVLMLTSQDKPRPEDRHPEGDRYGWFRADLVEHAHGDDGKRGPNVFALASWILDAVVGHVPARVAEAASGASGPRGREERELARGLRDGAEALSAAGDHAYGVLAVARAIVRPFATPLAGRALYVGCEPALESAEALEVPALMSGDTPRFIVYEPRDDGSDYVVAMALKQLFLESAQTSPAGRLRTKRRPFVGTSRAISSGSRQPPTSPSSTVPGPPGPSRCSHPGPYLQSSTRSEVTRDATPSSRTSGAPLGPRSSCARPTRAPRSSLVASPPDGPHSRICSTYARSRGSLPTRPT